MSIGDIKKELKAISLEDEKGLLDFIDSYSHDERAGVIAIVEQAKKKLDAYRQEVIRSEKML